MVLDGKSCQEYPVNTGVLQASIFGPAPFLLYINDLPDEVSCNIATSAMIPLSIVQKIRLYGISQIQLLDLNLTYKTKWTGLRSGLLISMLKISSLFNLTSLITRAVDLKLYGSTPEKKKKESSFKMLKLSFPSKLDLTSYIVSITKVMCASNLEPLFAL